MTPDRNDLAAAPESRARLDRRESALSAAYDLFCQHGIQAIGIDRIVAEAGVAKMTLYRHFRSKDELVIAALERREESWTINWLIRESERRARTPAEQLIAIFDSLDEWFRRENYEGCLFINTLLETHDHRSPVGARAALGLSNVRKFIRRLAEEAGVPDPESFARQWQTLVCGAIVQASSGHSDAAVNAREVGFLLLQRELGAGSGSEGRSSADDLGGRRRSP